MCEYRLHNGDACPFDGAPLCYWHDPKADKNQPDLKQRLEQLIADGHSLEGFRLARADLSGIHLLLAGQNRGVCLRDADLYRANLQGAHMFRIDLRGASLMKADCRDANLHFADLTQTNLLGTRFDGAKIENIEWGAQLRQQTQAQAAVQNGNAADAADAFEQAEEICRGLRKVSEQQGLFELAGHFFYEEMLMRRHQMAKPSFARTISWLVDLFCGYGEKPLRVIVFSLCLIGALACCYFLLGIRDGDSLVQLDLSASFGRNLMNLLTTVYFSVVTFTTLGYGDLVPVGASRLLAAVEAFMGSFTLALFVVVFVKKMTR
ncbi:pentapeptide repeat-containing protein [Thalassolituus sp. LLYu03]|uniref:pentapeptide repeat-containing protein n=1 Tax=Thalassolituus sp. LLYu03 TaxID=3421656 RepID=UPI003D2E54FF